MKDKLKVLLKSKTLWKLVVTLLVSLGVLTTGDLVDLSKALDVVSSVL